LEVIPDTATATLENFLAGKVRLAATFSPMAGTAIAA
jgi:hypothetical protein